MSEMRRVTAICNGTVVDHIPAGKALQVMQMLEWTLAHLIQLVW
ncbi:MAG: hypothetical protein Ct9H90mP14_2010 [Methanobacteriota archaeon]|nr:MAG: hypothetical protein Ct9H90mP14_2010 [Euryarchaeota archaeon]